MVFYKHSIQITVIKIAREIKKRLHHDGKFRRKQTNLGVLCHYYFSLFVHFNFTYSFLLFSIMVFTFNIKSYIV